MVHLATQKFDIKKLALSYLVAATAVLSGCGGSSESEFEQIVRQSNCVTADQVYSDYQNNEVAAQQKYQGNVTRICGVIDEIELNLFNEPLISLRASLLGSVSIGGVDTASAANISKGSVAVFECNKINELLGIPVLMECRIVPTQNMQNEATSASEVSTPNGGDAVDASASQDQSCSGYATYVATNEATEIDSVYGTTKVCEIYNDVNGNPFKSCPSTLKVGDTLDYATPSNDRPDPIVCQHGGSCYKSSDLVLKNCQ